MEQIKDNEVIGLKSVIVDYLSHWRLFLGVFAFSLLVAILYLLLYPRTYEAMARIQLQESEDASGIGGGLMEAAGLMKSFGLSTKGGGLNMEDELNMMKSNSLMKKVALDLGLNAEYTRPFSFYRLYETSPFLLTTDSLANERLAREIKFSVRPKDGVIHVKAKSNGTEHSFSFTSLPAVMALPEGNFTLGRAPGKELLVEDMNILYKPATWVAEEMAKNFLIEDYSKNSNIIELSCTDYESSRAINTLNSLISYYNRETGTIKQGINSKTLAYIDTRIDSTIQALKSIEYKIAEFKNLNAMTSIEYDIEFHASQIRDMQSKVIELETQSYMVKLMSDFVKDPANKYNPMPGLMSQDGGDKNSSITLYNQALIERERIIQSSSSSNPLATSLTERADKLRESVFLSIGNLQEATNQAIAEIKNKEKVLFSAMRSFPDKERDYREMMRQQEIIQGIYLILLQKREGTALSDGLNNEKGRVIDAAYIKQKTVAPRKLFAAIGILLFTLIIPVVWLFCKEQTLSLIREYRQRKSCRV